MTHIVMPSRTMPVSFGVVPLSVKYCPYILLTVVYFIASLKRRDMDRVH